MVSTGSTQPSNSQRQQHQQSGRGEYLLLRINQLMLILPQQTVSHVRHLSDDEILQIHASQHVLQPNGIHDDKKVWFAALSDDLTLMPTLPKERFLLTTFVDYPNIRWCWQDLYQISGADYKRFDLPDIIRTNNTPVHALAVLDAQRRAFFTTPQDIIRFAQVEAV